MFKKKCKNCGEGLNKKYRYCPRCGGSLAGKTENLGMFGRDDFLDNQVNLPRGLNLLFSSLMKNLNKQFKELDREIGEDIGAGRANARKGGISVSISTAPGKEPEIKMKSFGPRFKQKEKEIKKQLKPLKKLPHKKLKTSKLLKKEPETNIRRLADKVIYEINMPGVKSMKDISIVQLENSIEIKAIAKDKAYIKLIPIKLPILDYSLEKGKLVLELEMGG